MRLFFAFVTIAACAISSNFCVLVADEEPQAEEEDSSAGLPEKYAKDYLIARSTISPDKKFAVIYPKLEAEEAAEEAKQPDRIKDCLIALEPFQILGMLPTDFPYFEHRNNADLSAEWSDDSSVALITLDGRSGPRDFFLIELHDGKVSRITNLARKAHDLLLPKYRKAKAARYNDYFDFIFVGDATFKFEGNSRVLIDGSVETSPGFTGDVLRSSDRAWEGHVQATWDIAQARFTSQKVSGALRHPAKK
jgi:hypothetical protein